MIVQLFAENQKKPNPARGGGRKERVSGRRPGGPTSTCCQELALQQPGPKILPWYIYFSKGEDYE